MSLSVSVIVSTRNRAASLDRCVQAFEALEFDPAAWELVVVDNGSTDHTDDVLRLFAARVPFRVTLLREPMPGVSRARNRGAQCAAAPLLAFTDDDCYVAPDFLTRVVEGFAAAEPACGYIGGRILLHDPTDAPETIKLDEAPAEIPADTCIQPGVLHGANLTVRREAWASVGGFDPQLGPGTPFCADDIDLIGRLSAAGWKGRYLPGPVVSHHHRRKPGPDIERLKVTYARGRGAYYAKGCLNPRLRRVYVRGWYWHLRRLIRHGDLDTARRELAAGIEYVYRVRLRQPLSPSAQPRDRSSRPTVASTPSSSNAR
jgi:glycosyltransferase involved in cell wall biosynthesis